MHMHINIQRLGAAASGSLVSDADACLQGESTGNTLTHEEQSLACNIHKCSLQCNLLHNSSIVQEKQH